MGKKEWTIIKGTNGKFQRIAYFNCPNPKCYRLMPVRMVNQEAHGTKLCPHCGFDVEASVMKKRAENELAAKEIQLRAQAQHINIPKKK